MYSLLTLGVRLLEAVFLTGLVGSVLVLVLSGVEDFRMLVEKDEPAESRAPRQEFD